MWGLPQKQNTRRADKIRLCGHLRRYKKIVKKTYIISIKVHIFIQNTGKMLENDLKYIGVMIKSVERVLWINTILII